VGLVALVGADAQHSGYDHVANPRRRILLDLAVRSGATLGNLAAGQLHASLPAAKAFTEVHAFQVRSEVKGRAVRIFGRQGAAVKTLRAAGPHRPGTLRVPARQCAE